MTLPDVEDFNGEPVEGPYITWGTDIEKALETSSAGKPIIYSEGYGLIRWLWVWLGEQTTNVPHTIDRYAVIQTNSYFVRTYKDLSIRERQRYLDSTFAEDKPLYIVELTAATTEEKWYRIPTLPEWCSISHTVPTAPIRVDPPPPNWATTKDVEDYVEPFIGDPYEWDAYAWTYTPGFLLEELRTIEGGTLEGFLPAYEEIRDQERPIRTYKDQEMTTSAYYRQLEAAWPDLNAPLIAVWDSNKWILWDGHHRAAISLRKGLDRVPCVLGVPRTKI